MTIDFVIELLLSSGSYFCGRICFYLWQLTLNFQINADFFSFIDRENKQKLMELAKNREPSLRIYTDSVLFRQNAKASDFCVCGIPCVCVCVYVNSFVMWELSKCKTKKYSNLLNDALRGKSCGEYRKNALEYYCLLLYFFKIWFPCYFVALAPYKWTNLSSLS